MWTALGFLGAMSVLVLAAYMRVAIRARNGRLPLWQAAALVAILGAGAIWEFIRLSDLERDGGTIWINRLDAFLYRVGGKWTVLLIGVACAAFVVWTIVRSLREHAAADRMAEKMAAPPRPPPAAKRAAPTSPRRPLAPVAPPPAEPVRPAATPDPASSAGTPGDGPRFLK